MTDDHLAALRRAAAAWGNDPTLVQGAGGNVSIKIDDLLWIKASGTWLVDADRQDIFVPVTMPVGDTPQVKAGWPTTLRPSIETSLHAALPHRVVVHVHSVDAIAHAVRRDARDALSQRLAGLNWAFIPYRKPGPCLTAAVREALAGTPADVLILGNHGLVVGADHADAAHTLLHDVVARLAIEPRRTAATHETAGQFDVPGFHVVTDPAVNSLATDADRLTIATVAPLYPDHVVFLGRAPLVVNAVAEIEGALERMLAEGHSMPRWIIVRGCAVLLADDALRGSMQMLGCLADVAARIAPGTPIVSLSETDIDALIDWDAERYRQGLAASPPPQDQPDRSAHS